MANLENLALPGAGPRNVRPADFAAELGLQANLAANRELAAWLMPATRGGQQTAPASDIETPVDGGNE